MTKKKVAKTAPAVTTEKLLDRIISEDKFLKSSGRPEVLIQRRVRAALALLNNAFELAQGISLDKDHVYGRPTMQLNNAILRCAAAEDGFRDLP